MNKSIQIMCVLAVLVGLGSMAMSKVNIETVPVGNAGNTGEWSGESYGGFGTDRICGAVDYAYNIGKYEVTAGQYLDFLNAVAKTDPYGLYNSSMNLSSYGCQITRNGASGNYTYDFSGGTDEAPGSTGGDWQDRPVNYVSWGDAVRFANWLHNDQPTGAQNDSTTEDGAYDLSDTHAYYRSDGSINDEDSLRAALMAVSRESDWKWAIPTEDEWYKAAYYNPDESSYFDYPTSSDSTPSNNLADPDPGNNATYYIRIGDWTIGAPYFRTEVGAHENSPSPYDTFDQGGNVQEWNEGEIGSVRRCLRGGTLLGSDLLLLASHRGYAYVTGEDDGLGFRVSEVPEPASMAVLALGGLAILRRRKRRDFR